LQWGMRFVCSLSLGLRPFSQKSASEFSSRLELAGVERIDAHGYLAGSLFLSIAVSLVMAIFLSFIFNFDALSLSGVFLLCFGASLGFLLFLPALISSARSQRMESELPFLLREMAVYLDIGLPFEKCLEKISEKDYALSKDFSFALRQMKSGAAAQAALSAISVKSPSMQVKRCMLLLSSIYDTGSRPDSLRRMADELSSRQLSAMRSQSGKLSLLSIIFVATSALVPSFFTVFAAVAPLVSSSPLSSFQIWLAFLFLFPLFNLAALGVILLSLSGSQVKSGGNASLIGGFLQKSGFPFGHSAFVATILCISFALAAVFLFFGQPTLSMACLCIAPALYSVVSHLSYSQIRKAEDCIPDALHGAASVHKIFSAEKTLSFLANGGFGLLSEAFEIALRRQKAGESFTCSLLAAKAACPSPLVDRAIDLLSVSYETGADMYAAMRQTAQDISSFFELVRERSAMLSVHRYTVMMASAVLVPFILGTIVSIVPSLADSASLSGQSGGQLVSELLPASQAYLLINSFLSAIAISLSESEPRKALLFFSAIAPVAQLCFFLASSGALSLAAG